MTVAFTILKAYSDGHGGEHLPWHRFLCCTNRGSSFFLEACSCTLRHTHTDARHFLGPLLSGLFLWGFFCTVLPTLDDEDERKGDGTLGLLLHACISLHFASGLLFTWLGCAVSRNHRGPYAHGIAWHGGRHMDGQFGWSTWEISGVSFLTMLLCWVCFLSPALR